MQMNTPAAFEPGIALPATLPPATLCYIWREDRILVRATEPPAMPTLFEVERAGVDGTRLYLGRLEGRACIALHAAADTVEPDGWQWRGLRSLFLQIPEAHLALAGRAFQIVEWNRNHAFCGRCATPTRDKGTERSKECPACGLIAYPRISPAMMVLVTRGRELLLARSNRFPNAMYSALAGFVEAGESIEDCIHREVLEEVGVEVDDLRYFASQSWPFPNSLMIAFTAEYVRGDMRPCDEEIVEAKWFSLDALPQLPGPVSISRQLINATVARLSAGE